MKEFKVLTWPKKMKLSENVNKTINGYPVIISNNPTVVKLDSAVCGMCLSI